MKSHELNVKSQKAAKRPGRGISAGRGKTAGRGTKGQSSRSGGKVAPGFEGGQTPFAQRVPKKKGFLSHRTKPQTVYTSQLDSVGVKVDNQSLLDAGVINNLYNDVKIVVKGEITKKHNVELAKASNSAIKMIEDAGGTFKAVPSPNRQAKKQ